MADVTLSKIQSALYEMRVAMQNLFSTRDFLLNAWAGKGTDGHANEGMSSL